MTLKLVRVLAAALTIIVVGYSLAAGDARPPDILSTAELRLALQRLQVLGSALYVAAHPDDENTALLAYLVGERKVRTAYLSVTRGDGGQNLIGPESGDLLGVIRTHELLSARRIDGAEQFFTRAVDFGYSKSADETVEIWNHDAVLSDVVWAIRRFRPDVIITRFHPDSGGGHGHHMASARLAEEAFDAAGNHERFPEQLSFVETWQPKRILWNAWRPGLETRDAGLPDHVTVDVGSYNPLLGRSYSEIAGESRSMHKSQGFGAPERRGSLVHYFRNRKGDPAQRDLFDGVILDWSRISGGSRVAQLLRQAERDLRPEAPHRIVPTLVRAYRAMSTLPADPLLVIKRRELHDVIRSCLGLWLEATAAQPAASPGGRVKIQLSALNRSGAAVVLESIGVPYDATAKTLAPDSTRIEVRDLPLAFNRAATAEANATLPADAPLTQPYWLQRPPGKGAHHVETQLQIGDPENPPALSARFVVRVEGERFTYEVPIAYKWTDPVAGERYRPFEVVPPVTLELDHGVYVFPDRAPRKVRVTVRGAAAGLAGRVRLRLPEGWRAEPGSHGVKLIEASAESSVTFVVHPPVTPSGVAVASANPEGVAVGSDRKLVAEIDMGGGFTSHRLVRLDYPHLPIRTLFPPAEAPLVRIDLARVGEQVGYLMGSGDRVPEALEQVGYHVTLLGDEDVASGNLQRFHAIVVGVRAFNTRPRLKVLNSRLLEYVRQGGTLVMQYNTAESSLESRLGPFPFKISRDRVTVEEAPVRLAKPTHPVLLRPNRIGESDFQGWVQERGLYFANPWDPRYETPLSSKDPGEPPRDGGLLVARHGRGLFIYTGYAWFRQLPAGVPGAYRLFVNLVSAK